MIHVRNLVRPTGIKLEQLWRPGLVDLFSLKVKLEENYLEFWKIIYLIKNILSPTYTMFFYFLM